MNDYKSMQNMVIAQGIPGKDYVNWFNNANRYPSPTDEEVFAAGWAHGFAYQQRFIAALESRIDALQQDKQNAALEYLSLEGQSREVQAISNIRYWQIINGERAFGTLWREATQADVKLMMDKERAK